MNAAWSCAAPRRAAVGRLLLSTACVAVALGVATPLCAGGNNDTFDITGFVPSPIPGQVIGTAKGYRWDDRCIPVHYRVNATLDPIPNGVGAPPISLAETMEGLERSFATWNEIPTSYIDMRAVGTTHSPVTPGFDFVNEVSFVWPAGLSLAGYSPATILLADSTFIHGEDLDGDGDADVSSAILTCSDVDGDGDIEFPAGDYKAGTMLDNDVILNPVLRFTVDGSDLDVPGTTDLVGVVTHELGHSHGLAHSGIVQTNVNDGTAATMHNTGQDGIGELALRTLHPDDIAWSSFLYPEGSRPQGPGALQPGDLRFDQRYSVIRGAVRNAQGRSVVGAVVFAEDLRGNIVASTIGGHARASIDPARYSPFVDDPFTLLPPELGIIDGKYELPVPKGTYRLGIEPNDGTPEPTLATRTGAIGYLYGSQNFIEEYWNGPGEGGTELRLGQALPVPALIDRHGVDFILDDNVHLLNINSIDASGIGLGPDGVLVAKRIPIEQVRALDRGRGVLIQAATFFTLPQETTPVAVFDAALITTGRVAANGSVHIDLKHPLVRQAPFVGQDLDYTPLYVEDSLALGLYARHVLPALGKDLFLVLAFPRDELPGIPGLSKYGIAYDVLTPGETDFGASYFSVDGGATWQRDTGVEYAFGLVVAPPAASRE